MDRRALGGEEVLDVVTVDRGAAISSVVVAEGRGPADRPEPGRAPHALESSPPTQRIGRFAELPYRWAHAHGTDATRRREGSLGLSRNIFCGVSTDHG